MAAGTAIVLLIIVIAVMLSSTECHSNRTQNPAVMRVAHRGGAGLAPENTYASFTVGLEQDADAPELDVHLSKDGVLMVMHDPLLERTTGQPGEISDYYASVLTGFNAAANYTGATSFGEQPIPTLEGVIALVESQAKRPILLQIEIKMKSDGSRYMGLEEKLVQMLRDYNRLDSSIIISFDFPSLTRIHELEPRLKRAALISRKYREKVGTGGPKAIAKKMASLGVDYVGINYSYLSQSLYDELRAQKLGIGVWTVNDANAIKRLAVMGVDFITSDRPDLLKDVFVSKS